MENGENINNLEKRDDDDGPAERKEGFFKR